MASLMEITQLCRLCLVKDQVNIPIFEEPGDIRQIFLKISACLPVKVAREDNLPKKICDGCSYKLEMFYEFWNTSASSEKQLLKWLEQVGIDKLPTSSDKSAQPQSHSINTDGVVLKQEVLDLGETHGDDDELPTDDLNVPTDPEYLLQQQSYQSFEFQTDGFNEGETASAAGPSSTITSGAAASAAPKRKRRAAAMKPLPPQNDSEDEDDTGLIEPKIAKTEEQSDDSAGEDHEPTTFVGLPDDNEQPGPSGVGKAATSSDAPHNIHQQPKYAVPGTITHHSLPSTTQEFYSLDTTLNTRNSTQILYTKPFGTDVKPILPVAADSASAIGANNSFEIPTEIFDATSKAPSKKYKMKGCGICGALFMYKDQVETHKITLHVKQGKMIGKFAKKSLQQSKEFLLSKRGQLLRLVETRTSSDGTLWCRCKGCFGLFQSNNVLFTHIANFHYEEAMGTESNDEECICLLCGLVYKSKPAVDLHMKKFHTTLDGKWKCNCDRLYTEYKHFQRHIERYTYPHFACSYCKRLLKTELIRREHEQAHEDKQNQLFHKLFSD